MNVTQFANTVNANYLQKRDELKAVFNQSIEKRTLYIKGNLVIPVEKVTPLRLGFRKSQRYVSYEKAFEKWISKNNLL